MSQLHYQRVDLDRIDHALPLDTGGGDQRGSKPEPLAIRWWVILLAVVLCAVQALITVSAGVSQIQPTSNLITVMGFTFLFVLVLAVNPYLHLLRRPFAQAEVWVTPAALVAGGLVLSLFYRAFLTYQTEVGASAPITYGSALTRAMLTVAAALPIHLALRVLFRGLGRWAMRPFSRAELMSIMAALLVTAGVSTFGLTNQLVPIIATPYNEEWNVPQAGWDKHLLPQLNDALYITDPAEVKRFRDGFREEPVEGAPTSVWMQHYWSTFKKVPWGVWLPPLFYWGIFVVASYAMFYGLTYLVLDYWSRREKLIFPLAKLHEALLPESDGGQRWLPSILRSPGFWAGFLVSFLVLAYNAAVAAQWLPGMGKISLGMNYNGVNALISGTFFAPLTGQFVNPLNFMILFTAVGIAFLLPLEISFSIWFYYVLSRVLLFVMVRMGYGADSEAFGTDWLWTQNAVTAQAAGAILLFSFISLVRCIRQYLVSIREQGLRGVGTIVRAMLPVVLLGASLLVMTGWIMWNGVPTLWAAAFVFFLALITLGLTRLVAEGGIYWFQSHASFFHLWKMLGITSLTPAMVGPLLPIYSVLFLDTKTFLAPNLANAAKLHQDVGGSRLKFHLSVLLSLAVSVVLSIGYSLVLAYSRGASRMDKWFYSAGPKDTIDKAVAAAQTVDQKFQWTTFSWFSLGMLWVALSMFLRRSIFWFPHPIGYIMLVNPLNHQLWFSFFLGWVLKKLVVQYGGKTTYDKARNVLIGLIVGELIAVAYFTAVQIYGGKALGITLNRYT